MYYNINTVTKLDAAVYEYTRIGRLFRDVYHDRLQRILIFSELEDCNALDHFHAIQQSKLLSQLYKLLKHDPVARLHAHNSLQILLLNRVDQCIKARLYALL